MQDVPMSQRVVEMIETGTGVEQMYYMLLSTLRLEPVAFVDRYLISQLPKITVDTPQYKSMDR